MRLTLPVLTQPAQPGYVFTWLHALYEKGRFLGFLRPPAVFDSLTGTLTSSIRLDSLHGTLFLPAVIVPAWVQNYDPEVHAYSGPTSDATDFGPAAPQFTTFTVLGPPVGGRLFVFNPVTQDYGWIDAQGVGPSGAPTLAPPLTPTAPPAPLAAP